MNAKVFLTCAAWPGRTALLYLAYHVQPAGTSGNGRGFDLPINDLIPPGMPLDSFRLSQTRRQRETMIMRKKERIA